MKIFRHRENYPSYSELKLCHKNILQVNWYILLYIIESRGALPTIIVVYRQVI